MQEATCGSGVEVTATGLAAVVVHRAWPPVGISGASRVVVVVVPVLAVVEISEVEAEVHMVLQGVTTTAAVAVEAAVEEGVGVEVV